MSVVGILGIADADDSAIALEQAEELLVDRPLDVDAGGRRAVLAAVDEAAGDRAAGRRLEVRVGVDDERRLAAELEVDPLEVARGELLDLAARLRVAGERDDVDVHVAGDGRADLVAGSGHDVEDAGRQTRPRAASSASGWSSAA